MKEPQIENRLIAKIKMLGGIPYKFSSAARRHVPDRLCVLPTGLIVFVECKSPGKKLRPAQAAECKKLQRLGHFVTVVDSYDSVDQLIEDTKEILYDREQRPSLRPNSKNPKDQGDA